jgi:hypothetical protein
MHEGEGGTPEDLFEGYPHALALCQEVQRAVAELGDVSFTTTKSQVAFRRRRGFAYVWRPGQYVVSDVPLVLSIALPHEVRSDRIKSVAQPSRNVWMHHIELRGTGEVDDRIRGWLAEAYANAG